MEDGLLLFAQGGDEGLESCKDLSAFEGTQAAADLLLDLGRSHVAFGSAPGCCSCCPYPNDDVILIFLLSASRFLLKAAVPAFEASLHLVTGGSYAQSIYIEGGVGSYEKTGFFSVFRLMAAARGE